LVQSAKPLEERFQNRIQRVERPIESAPAKPTAEVRRTLEPVQSIFKIAAEKRAGTIAAVITSRSVPLLKTFLMVAS
jgi:hypothetical protein